MSDTPQNLAAENARLAEQVKGLIRAESRLYVFQEQLDRHRRLYEGLARLGQITSRAKTPQEVLAASVECAVVHLGFQKAVACIETPEGVWPILCEGYYDEVSSTRLLDARWPTPAFDALFSHASTPSLLTWSPQLPPGHELGMDQAYRILFESDGSPHSGFARGWLVFGNENARRQFHTRVDLDGPLLTLLDNFSSMLTSALLNVQGFMALQAERDQLDDRVRERTRELALALEQAKEAERSRTEFFTSISHELRTPLNAIINLPEGLLEEFELTECVRCMECRSAFALDKGETAPERCPECSARGVLRSANVYEFRGDPEQTRQRLQSVVSTGRHLLHVINDILDMSKLEAGKMELHLELCSLPELLETASRTLEPLAQPKGVKLAWAQPDQLWGMVDGTKVQQMVINLVSNAIKFSPEGGTVRIELSAGDGTARLTVQDEGIGISPEDQSKLFQSFRQISSGDKRRYGGSGLGLAITRRLVEIHQGQIQVESHPDRGSLFTVELPLRGTV